MTAADTGTAADADRDAGTGVGSGAGARRRRAFVLLGGVQVTLIFTLAAIAVPLPLIGRDLDLRRADLILLSAAYGLTFAGLLLLGGRVADRYGGRRALAAGLLVFAAASAAAPLSPTVGILLAARFAQGAGAALVAPAAMAVLRAVFPTPAGYGRAMATWGGLSVIGATAGNLLSGVVAEALSWRWALAAPFPVAVAALVLLPRWLPATAPNGRRALDVPGALLVTGGITAASYALVITDARPWASADVLLPLAAGIALLGVFAHVERRARDPLLPPRFLRDRRRALALLTVALSSCGTAMTFVVLSLHFQQARDWSPARTSAAFVPFAAVLLASGRAAGPLIRRYGARAVTAGGLGVGAAGLALLALTGFDPAVPYSYGPLPGLVVLPAGVGASFAGGAVLATDGVPRRQTGLAGGVLNTAMELGPTVLFAVLLTLGSDAASLGATGAALAVAALAAALAHRRDRRPARPAPPPVRVTAEAGSTPCHRPPGTTPDRTTPEPNTPERNTP